MMIIMVIVMAAKFLIGKLLRKCILSINSMRPALFGLTKDVRVMQNGISPCQRKSSQYGK